MKNLVLSENTIPTPEDEGKYVNYAKAEDKVNYFGEFAEEPAPEVPEISEDSKPALADIPDRVSIAVNNGGMIAFIAPADYILSDNRPVLGLGIKRGGNAFIMATPDNPQKMVWSTVLEDIKTIPNIATTLTKVKDFSSKSNTFRMLEAQPTQATSAIYCRNYTTLGLGKGKWDLPTAGILNIIAQYRDEVISTLKTMGRTDWCSILENDSVWSSTEYNSNESWIYSFPNLPMGFTTGKNKDKFVVPVHTLYQEPTDLSEMLKPYTEMPDGVSIVDVNGNYVLPSKWVTGDPWTGLALNTPKWKGILGVGTDYIEEPYDDISINSSKYWSNALYQIDIPGLTNRGNSNEAIKEFDSKSNTDAILSALATSSNPQETNNAAVVCRNYEAGVLGKGKWDLPAAGILNIIIQSKEEIMVALEKLGTPWKEVFVSKWIWSSTEYSSGNSWYYVFNGSDWYTGNKDTSNCVVPVYEMFLSTETKPEDIVLPNGVSVVDGSGNVMKASEWTADKGLTGLGLSDGTHKFIMGVSNTRLDELHDDMSIASFKSWSDVLYGKDVPGLTNKSSSSEAMKEFDSKANTDAILAALVTSSNPQETNNAAVVARNYEAGVIGKGKWDLPTAGILNIIAQYRDEVISTLEAIGKTAWASIFKDSYVWSSTEYSSDESWFFVFVNISFNKLVKDYISFVVPVFTIP